MLCLPNTSSIAADTHCACAAPPPPVPDGWPPDASATSDSGVAPLLPPGERDRVRCPKEDESALLARLRAGDEDAFETLVRNEGARLLSRARTMLGDEDDARDAVQEAFLSAYKALDRFSGRSTLSTWLHRIVINAALMKLRSRKRRPEVAIEDLLPEFDHHGQRVGIESTWEETAQDLAEREELREQVRDRIERLPEPYRTVLLLRDIEGLDTQETARVIGISGGLVKVRLHRARQALKTLLEPARR
jgi:RNA polymerase sigma-70 factor (ECF subfamily)